MGVAGFYPGFSGFKRAGVPCASWRVIASSWRRLVFLWPQRVGADLTSGANRWILSEVGAP